MTSFPQTIFELVKSCRDDFLNNYIEIVPGYQFNQYETIKKIHKYYNSQFDGSNYEEINGVKRKKTFYNISKWRCMVATKMIDKDVKDLLVIPTVAEKEKPASLFGKALKKWLGKHKLGKLLNKISRALPIYGTVVLEKTKDGAQLIDLRYLMNDQSVEKLTDSWFIIKDLMSAGDLRKKIGIWENVEEAIDKYCNYSGKSYEDSESLNQAATSPYAEVYRFHGEVPLSWFTNKQKDEDKWVKARWFVCGLDSEGVVLYKEQLEEYPVKECHYDRTEGRWLGIGIVEDTFEAQRRTNEIKNQEAKALELGSMIVFQSQDQLSVNNVLSDIDNGDIIRSLQGITRVDNVNRAMPDFNASQASYDQQADRTTFSYDVVRGESAPASSTLGAVQLQTAQASSVFDYHGEDYSLFLSEFFKDLVFPQLEKELQKEYEFPFVGSAEEVSRIREDIVEELVAQEVLNQIPAEQIAQFSPEQMAQLEADMEMAKEATRQNLIKQWGNKLWFKATKDYFKDISKFVDIEISGEGRNVSSQLANVQYFLTTIAQNPGVLQNPVLKSLMFKIMSLVGMDSSEIESLQQEQEEQQAQMMSLNLPNQQLNAAPNGTGV